MEEAEVQELVARLDERGDSMAAQLKVMAENLVSLTAAVHSLTKENQRIAVLEAKIQSAEKSADEKIATLEKSNGELWKVVRANEAKEAADKNRALWDLVKLLVAVVLGGLGDHFMGGK